MKRIMAIEESFKAIRMRKGYSAKSLAQKLGVSNGYITMVENRIRGVRPDKSQLILEILDAEFDDIFEIVESNTEA